MLSSAIPTANVPLQRSAAFINEPFEDFQQPEIRRAMEEALAQVKGELGREYDLVIDGKRIRTGEKIVSVNPARPGQVVGIHQEPGVELADKAVAAALRAFETWSRKPVEERAELLFRASEIVRERKFTLCAWLTFEVGKNWAEADADVGETIDFLEFYAREALRLAGAKTPIQYAGEKNTLKYLPLGVGAVIPPWNFPLAIMAGMTVASIVVGNTVVLKPSVDAPTIAAKFFEILEEAGLPDGVVNLCPGTGPTFGDAIVRHKDVRFIAFTGSKAVGLEIHERAAKTQPGQKFIKRTVLEMGGKDSIIVDASADVDAAVEGVVASAFGFNGQKCSACSRVIIDTAIYDDFVSRVQERIDAIKIGDPVTNAYAGPVISKTAFERVLRYIEIGKSEGRLLNGGEAVKTEDGGYYVSPTFFADIAPDARIAQEEIFGPVLAAIKSKNFDHALEIANSTEYGLTGAIYSTQRDHLERAAEEFHVGNLYLNRKCTGAMVGAHPFGGFNMSGTDSKAGGPDYLLLFTQGKSVAEKLGTVPESKAESQRPEGI
jgi:1-pyrroline-5-carboxylate dehydrogenase